MRHTGSGWRRGLRWFRSTPASSPRRRGAEIAHIKARDRLAALGMSAHVAVTVYERPAALLVPIGAVERAGGEAWLRVLDRRTGDAARRAVALGITTLDSVEVTAGLAAGEEIVLPAGGSGAGGAPFNGAFSR